MTTVRRLPEDLQKVAQDELNEVDENIEKELKELRKWIENQPHLRARLDDQFLLAFLRACKHNVERAKLKVDLFYTVRTHFPDIFGVAEKDLRRNIDLLRLGVLVVLPRPLPDNGSRVMFARVKAYSPSDFHYYDVLHLAHILIEILLREDDRTSTCGLSYIIDFDDVTTSHLFQFTPSLLKKINVWSEEALPVPYKNCSFINVDNSFEAICSLYRSMFSEELQPAIYSFRDNLDEFHKLVPKKFMPQEYGGDNGSIPELAKYWEGKILSHKDYFAEEANYGTDEKLRLGKPFDFKSYFGE